MTELQAPEREFIATEDTVQLQRWGFTTAQVTVILGSAADLRAHPTQWVLPRPNISSGLDGWSYIAT